MSDTPGPGVGAAVAGTRPVMLVRYRPGTVGEAARTVHVVSLPIHEHAGAVTTWCGAALKLDDLDTVTPGEGMPCTMCLVTYAMTSTTTTGKPSTGSPPDSLDAVGTALSGACYQHWSWPVTIHHDQVQLDLAYDVSALAIPISLCSEVTAILIRRRCTPAVLAHPYIPDHHILLTGERYGMTLPWPYLVHQITGVLLLPPTVTPRGPITWTRPPHENSLRLCREIDLFGALRTAR